MKSLHRQICAVLHVLFQDLRIQTNHRAVFEQIISPTHFLLGHVEHRLVDKRLFFFGDLLPQQTFATISHISQHALSAFAV
ncbi:Uncharacterised protein [Klebsiella pneumoniae]|nr:Uncharacterised protein [Klebsiella pneumoniae]